jgi:hypothetical protein
MFVAAILRKKETSLSKTYDWQQRRLARSQYIGSSISVRSVGGARRSTSREQAAPVCDREAVPAVPLESA